MLSLIERIQLIRKQPGPGLWPVLKVTKQMMHDPLETLVQNMHEFGDIVTYQLGGECTVQVTDPEFIGYIFEHDGQTFKKARSYTRLERLLGKGLVTSSGQQWKLQRTMAAPLFHPKKIADTTGVIIEETETLLSTWIDKQKHQGSIDISDEMSRLTVSVIMKVLFSVSLSDADKDTIKESLEIMQDYVHKIFYHPAPLPLWVPSQANQLAQKAIADFNRIVYPIIERRRQSREQADDLLAAYLNFRDPTSGKELSTRLIRDEMVTFMLAGHDTTANALSVCFHLLSKRPELVQDIRDEFKEHTQNQSVEKAIRKIKLPKMAFQETLRLYPSVWGIARESTEAFTFRDIRYPKKTQFIISPYATHRNPRYWPDPETFDINRFQASEQRERVAYSYFPFGGGPRVCIGMNVSLTEAQIIIPMVLNQFELSCQNFEDLKLEARIVLVPSKHIRLKVAARNQPGSSDYRKVG